MQIGAQRLGSGLVGRILCKDHVNHEHDRERYAGEPQHCVPSEQFSHDRREQCGKYRARIAHSGYAHRFSLMLGRIPARCEGQRHCKAGRSEEHTSELQSLMRISYAVFCLKKKRTPQTERKKNKETSSTVTTE